MGDKLTTMSGALAMIFEFYTHCIDTLERKNAGYADVENSHDVLANFRQEAARHGISKLQLSNIYRGKHDRSWDTFVRKGSTSDKPWRILKDRINYALLEYLICLEEGAFTVDEVMNDTGEDA